MQGSLFNSADVPADAGSPAEVGEANAIVEKLRERLVDRVEFPEPVSLFRVSNEARVYSLCHLRRCLQLIDAAHDLVYAGRGLAALMMVRGLYETVANYVAVSKQLVDLIEATAPLKEIHDFIHNRIHDARSKRLIKIVGTDAVKPTNILTQVQKMNRLRGTFEEEYEALSESTHPNAFGATLYFFEPEAFRHFIDGSGDVHVFAARGYDPNEDLKWVLVGAHILTYFADAMDRLEAVLPGLSERGRTEAPSKPLG
jgi:hypothetical protein